MDVDHYLCFSGENVKLNSGLLNLNNDLDLNLCTTCKTMTKNTMVTNGSCFAFKLYWEVDIPFIKIVYNTIFFVCNIYNKTTLSLRMFYQHIYINISTTHVMSLELGEIPKAPKWIEMKVYTGNLANVVSETYHMKVCTQTKMGFETD